MLYMKVPPMYIPLFLKSERVNIIEFALKLGNQ